MRVPGQIFTLATLFLALLAGGGPVALRRLRAPPRGPAAARGRGAVVILIGIVGEGAGRLGHPVVPQPAPGRDRPSRARSSTCPPTARSTGVWQYYSTDGFPKIPIGNSTFDIRRAWTTCAAA